MHLEPFEGGRFFAALAAKKDVISLSEAFLER